MRYQVARQGLREGFRPSGGIVTRWMVAASVLFLFTAWNMNSTLAENDPGYPAEYNTQCKGTENTSHTISPQSPYKIDYDVRDAWCRHIKELLGNQSQTDGTAEAGLDIANTCEALVDNQSQTDGTAEAGLDIANTCEALVDNQSQTDGTAEAGLDIANTCEALVDNQSQTDGTAEAGLDIANTGEALVDNQSQTDGIRVLRELAGIGNENSVGNARAAFYVGSDLARIFYPSARTLYQNTACEWVDGKLKTETLASASKAKKLATDTREAFEKVLLNIDRETNPVDKWPRSMFVHPFDFTSYAQIANLSGDISVISILTQPDPKKPLDLRDTNHLSATIESLGDITTHLARTTAAAAECKGYTSPPKWNAPRHYAEVRMKAECDKIHNIADELLTLESNQLELAKGCEYGDKAKCSKYTEPETLEKIDKLINEFSSRHLNHQEELALNSFLSLWNEQDFWQPQPLSTK